MHDININKQIKNIIYNINILYVFFSKIKLQVLACILKITPRADHTCFGIDQSFFEQ